MLSKKSYLPPVTGLLNNYWLGVQITQGGELFVESLYFLVALTNNPIFVVTLYYIGLCISKVCIIFFFLGTTQAVEKVHSICTSSKGSTELIAELSTLYHCIRFPVVSVGVIRLVQILSNHLNDSLKYLVKVN